MAQTRQDMGSGNVKKLLLQLMIPAVVAQVVNLLYNIVDRIYIGHIAGIGAAALTGVGLFAPILMLLNAFAMLIGAGGAPRTAIALGQGNKEEAEKIIGNSFTMLLFFAVVLTIGFYAGAPILLRLFGASEATLPYALAYSRIYILGSVCVLLVMGMNPFITTQGFAKISMLTTVIGAVINIILDPILISVVGMGAMGEAVATVIGYFCSVLYFLWLLRKKSRCLSVNPSLCHVSGGELRQILGVGVTAALSNLMQSLCVIVVNQFLLPYGNDKIAAMGIVLKVNMIAQLVLTGFAFGGVPLFGYLYGAQRRAEMRKLVRFCLGFLCALSLVLTAVLCLFASPLMGAFVKDTAMIATGAEMLHWQAASTVFAGIVLLLTVLFQATGKVGPSFVLSISRQGVVFVAALLVCVKLFAYNGVLMGQAVADVVSALIALGLLVCCNPMRSEP